MESNHKKMPESRCDICGTVFWTEIQLKTHKKTHHAKESFKNQQFNCNDCPFQGETGLELKNHIQRTKHTFLNVKCVIKNSNLTDVYFHISLDVTSIIRVLHYNHKSIHVVRNELIVFLFHYAIFCRERGPV